MPHNTPEKRRAYLREKIATDPEFKAHVRARQQKYYSTSKRAAELRERYREDDAYREEVKQKRRQERLAKQELQAGRPRPDVCDLCGAKHPKIVFDHCHKTGAFRGWLCDPCNRYLGYFDDSLDGILRLLAYLDRGRVRELTNSLIRDRQLTLLSQFRETLP